MRWFGKAVPLIAMGKKTVKQPVHVSKFQFIIILDMILLFYAFALKNLKRSN